MNDGTGYLKKRQCGGICASALELARYDGDGDLDALVGAAEFDKYNRISLVLFGMMARVIFLNTYNLFAST